MADDKFSISTGLHTKKRIICAGNSSFETKKDFFPIPKIFIMIASKGIETKF